MNDSYHGDRVMPEDKIKQLLDLMRRRQNERLEWSRAEMIRELEQVGVGYREADRVITLAEDRGLLDARPIGRSNRKRYFIRPAQ